MRGIGFTTKLPNMIIAVGVLIHESFRRRENAWALEP